MNKIADRLSPAPEAVPTRGFRASLQQLFRPAALAAALGGSAGMGCWGFYLGDNFPYCPTADLSPEEVEEKCGGNSLQDACGKNMNKEGYDACKGKFEACFAEICPPDDSATASIGGSGDIINPTTTDPTATSGTVGETSGGTAPGETTGIETTSTTGTDSTTTGSTTMDTTTSTTGDMTTGEAPYCGDGNIDAGEECDNAEKNLPKEFPCDNAEGLQCNADCIVLVCPPNANVDPQN